MLDQCETSTQHCKKTGVSVATSKKAVAATNTHEEKIASISFVVRAFQLLSRALKANLGPNCGSMPVDRTRGHPGGQTRISGCQVMVR